MLDPDHPLGRRRREARLRRPADVRRPALHRGPGRARGRRRRDRRRADGRATSDRPGTRFGPRAIRAAGCAAGPAPRGRRRRVRRRCGSSTSATRRSSRPTRSARTPRSRRTVGAGARRRRDPDRARRRPLDRRARRPRLRRAARAGRPDPLRHPHRHRPPRCSASSSRTARRCTGSSRPGHVDPRRYVQIGLRGYWPGAEEFAWQREHGITAHPHARRRATGHRAPSSPARSRVVGDGPVFLTVDVDVLDPAFAPGTGTPEPGGMTAGRPAVGVPPRSPSGCSSSAPTSSRSRRRRSARPTRPRSSPTGSSARS